MTQTRRRSTHGLRSVPLLMALAAMTAVSGCGDDKKIFIDNTNTAGTTVLTFTGTISGKVYVRATGQAVRGALVTTSANGTLRTAITDAGGNYSFGGLPYLSNQSTTYEITIDLRSTGGRVVTLGTDNTPATNLTDFAYTSATFSSNALLYDPNRFVLDTTGFDEDLTVGEFNQSHPVIFQNNMHIVAPTAAVRRVGASLRGTVVNENGQPLSGVLVSAHEFVGGGVGNSDPDGFFGNIAGIEHSMSVAAVTTDANGTFTLTNLPEEDKYDLHIDGTPIGFHGTPNGNVVAEVGLAGLTTTMGRVTIFPNGSDVTPPALTQVAGAAANLFGLSSQLDLNQPVTIVFNEPMAIGTLGDSIIPNPSVVLALDANGNGIAESFEQSFSSVQLQAVPGTNGTRWNFLLTSANDGTPPPSGAGVNPNTPPMILSLRNFRDLTGNLLLASSSGLTGAQNNPLAGGNGNSNSNAGGRSFVEVQFSTRSVEPSGSLTVGLDNIPAGNSAQAIQNGDTINFDNLGGPFVFTFNTPMLVRTGSPRILKDANNQPARFRIARDTNQNGVWDAGDFQLGGSGEDGLTFEPAEILGTAGVLSDTRFVVRLRSPIPGGLGLNPISTSPLAFAPDQERIVIALEGVYDASGNLWQGQGLGSGIVINPANGSPNFTVNSSNDPTLLVASGITVGPDTASQVRFLPNNDASLIPQLNQSNFLDQSEELQLMGPFYSNTTVNPAWSGTGLPAIPLNTKFGLLPPAGTPAITQHVDRARIAFNDPSNAIATATEFQLYLGTSREGVEEDAAAGDAAGRVARQANTVAGGSREFLVNMGDASVLNDRSPFDGGETVFGIIRTVNQFGRAGLSAVFEIADQTRPTVGPQPSVPESGPGNRTGIASPTAGRPASDTLRFDLFTGDLDRTALNPARTPTFLPIVEITGRSLGSGGFDFQALDDRSNTFDDRREESDVFTDSYSPADFIAASTQGTDGKTDFTQDTTVFFNEALAENITTYFGFLGDIVYTGNTFVLKGDLSGSRELTLEISNPFAARTGDTIAFPNVRDQQGLTVGSGAKAVVRDVTPPMLTGARLTVDSSRVGTLTLTFNKNVWAAPQGHPEFAHSALNPAVYTITDGDGNTLNLAGPAPAGATITVTANVVTIVERSRGSAGVPFEQLTADWFIRADVRDELNRHSQTDIAHDLGASVGGATTGTGDKVPPVILTGVAYAPFDPTDFTPTAVTSGGSAMLPGDTSVTVSAITLIFHISEDCINHANVAVGSIPAQETCVDGNLLGTPPAGSFNARVRTAIQPLLNLFNTSGLTATMSRTDESIDGNLLTITVQGTLAAVPSSGQPFLNLTATGGGTSFTDAAGNVVTNQGRLVLGPTGIAVQN